MNNDIQKNRPFFRLSIDELNELLKTDKSKELIERVVNELKYRNTKASKKLLVDLSAPKNIRVKVSKRPHINKLVHELKWIYEENSKDKNILLTLINELSYRRTKKAILLKQQIINEVSGDSINNNLSKNQKRKFFRNYYSDDQQEKIINKIKNETKFLTDKEEKILKLRKSGLTLEEISLQFNVTRERIRQILVKIETKGYLSPKNVQKIKRVEASRKQENFIQEYLKLHKTKFIQQYKKNFSDIVTAENLELKIKIFKAIANKLISEELMDRRLKVFNEDIYNKQKKEWDEIAAMRKHGYSNQKIANIFGISSAMISVKISQMKANGYYISPYGMMADRDYSKDIDDEAIAYRSKVIRELNNQGISKKQIAKKLNLGYRDIFRHIDLYMVDY